MTVGIIPAAGKASRIHGLPKYLLPVPGGYLLERMLSRIGVPCYIGTNTENYELISTHKRFEDYVYQADTLTMCETILAVRPYTGDENILMGMPDTYFTDKVVFRWLADCLNKGAVCAVATFLVSAEMASRLGVCIQSADGYLGSIEDKQPQIDNMRIWGALGWRSDFWQYIHPEDANPSFSMQRAIDAGVKILLYPAFGNYYDCGTPEGYFRCIRELTQTEVVE